MHSIFLLLLVVVDLHALHQLIQISLPIDLPAFIIARAIVGVISDEGLLHVLPRIDLNTMVSNYALKSRCTLPTVLVTRRHESCFFI